MDPVDIQAVTGSIRTALEITSSLIPQRSSSKDRERIANLQAALLEVQAFAMSASTAQFEQQERIRELEGQLRLATDWGDQKSRYALVCPWQNAAQVYALKRCTAEGEEPHYICPNCFHNRHTAVLIPTYTYGWLIMSCPSCKATLHTSYRGTGPPQYAEDFLDEQQ